LLERSLQRLPPNLAHSTGNAGAARSGLGRPKDTGMPAMPATRHMVATPSRAP